MNGRTTTAITAGVLVVLAAVLAGGCTGSAALTYDTAASRTESVTATRGAGFAMPSADGTATFVVLPGTFPAGTKVSCTPVSGGLPAGGVSQAYSLKAEKDGAAVQPEMPVLLSFAVRKTLEGSPTLVAYADDDPSSGEALPTSVTTTGGVTFVYAEASHFTIFRIDAEGRATQVTPGSGGSSGSGSQTKKPSSGKKQTTKPTLPDKRRWKIVIGGEPETSFIPSNDIWTFVTKLNAEVECDRVNSFAGKWRGPAGYSVKGTVDPRTLLGAAAKYLKATGGVDIVEVGDMSFTLSGVSAEDDPFGGERDLPTGETVPVEEVVQGTGQLKVFGSGRLDAAVTGPNIGGGFDKSTDRELHIYPVSVLLSPSGVWVQVDQIGVWRGVLVVVPVQ